MPVLKSGDFSIDYLDVGKGHAIVLIHGAASNNKQWRQLIEDYQHQYRFLAINLFGYGETSPWPGEVTQTMADQVNLVDALCATVEENVCLVGHSFGGAVAMYSALALREKVAGLVLLEANPFPLLASEKDYDAYNEILELRDSIKDHGNNGNWELVAERFVDYWLGDTAWTSLTTDRQQAFISVLPNNSHEWDAVMSEDVSAEMWRDITASTFVIQARETKNPIKSICKTLRQACPHWQFGEIPEGGHMAPVTRPDLVNPMILDFVKGVFGPG